MTDIRLVPAVPATRDVGSPSTDAPIAPPSLAATGPELVRRFDLLRAECRRAVEEGRLDTALARAEAAIEIAETLDDPRLLDLARCNRAAVAIALGRFGDEFGDLRRILMRNHCAETSFAAAYHLSHAYELRKEFKKGLFYARVARDRAQAAHDEDVLAKSYNQIGVCLLGDSYFEQAATEFEKALDRLGDEEGIVRAMLIGNRAYCRMVLGDFREAFGDLFRCLRWYRRHGAHLYAVWPHLFLCYGYLETGRLVHAWRHANKALALAEEHGDEAALKNALFLLAEVEKAGGDLDAARDCFERMRRRFYPDAAALPSAVTAVGMAKVVNLRA
ncbi:MAG: hypothetical protein AAGC60_15635 [Acidobacteriota bacterium]